RDWSSDVCSSDLHDSHINQVAVSDRGDIRNDCRFVNTAYRLDVALFVQHLYKTLTQRVVVDSHERLALSSDKLKKPIVVHCAQYRDAINLFTMLFLVIIEESIDGIPVFLENHSRLPSQ